MTASTRRRLFIGVVVAAAALVGGRALSAFYADYSWYAAHGAAALWSERAGDSFLVYGIGFTLAVVIAFVNLSALGRSIGVLTLPRRLANVEFGEAVPRRYIDRFAFVLALAIAAAVTPALPRWTALALAKLDVRFRESDPYFQHDLSFYTTWLPFEKATYAWAMLLIVIVAVLVVLLYSLTPGLRWEGAGLRMSTHVRRHLSVLAALLLLITMWSYRLQSYDLLINGNGEEGVFSYIDHQWLLPGLLLLSIATAAGAITVLLSGWTGQLRTSFIAVTVIVVLSVTIQEIIPLSVRRFTSAEAQMVRERPYAATRADFNRRAYGQNAALYDTLRKSGVSAALDSVVTSATGRQLLRQDSLVYPGAHGLVVVADPQLDVSGQRVGDGLPRLGLAWAYQSFDLLSDSVPRRARIVTVRDLRTRLRALAPAFAQGTVIEPMFHADTLYWKLELYSASADYPLSRHFVLAGEERSYFRHAATALVNARTARVLIAADPATDPIAQAWMTAFPNSSDYRAPGVARELTATPWEPVNAEGTSAAEDSSFRAAVTRLYNKMRAALAASDLKAFGVAYDSLGALIGTTHR
ncbi:MAG TPA: UPF0182 family protein [Gemmatimonadaceae bacterium]|nr:UPF0182 family protein [Gemmatimonadaceae bacterium]